MMFLTLCIVRKKHCPFKKRNVAYIEIMQEEFQGYGLGILV